MHQVKQGRPKQRHDKTYNNTHYTLFRIAFLGRRTFYKENRRETITMTMTGTWYSSIARRSLLFVTVSSLAGLVSSEIRSFSGIIEAASTVVHYSEGFLIAPAYIDIGDLVFQTIDDGDVNYVPTERPNDDGNSNGDKRSPDEVDDDKVDGETPTKVTNPPAVSGGGRERRILADDTSSAGNTVRG